MQFFIKKLCEIRRLETSSRPFLIFKESSTKRNLRRSAYCLDNFRQICYYISIISSLIQKFYFLIEAVLNFLQTQEGLELVLMPQFFQNYLINFFLLYCGINWPNFINRLCLLSRLFSEMHFLFYAQAFDDFMKFENVEF